jgi:hypothetical protein
MGSVGDSYAVMKNYTDGRHSTHRIRNPSIRAPVRKPARI